MHVVYKKNRPSWSSCCILLLGWVLVSFGSPKVCCGRQLLTSTKLRGRVRVVNRRKGHGWNNNISGILECYDGLLETINEVFSWFDSRSFSARSQRTGLLICLKARVSLSPCSTPVPLLAKAASKSSQRVDAPELSWLTPSKVFPNITVHWSPLPSSSRAWGRPARRLFLQAFPKKYLAEKVPARRRADVLVSET